MDEPVDVSQFAAEGDGEFGARVVMAEAPRGMVRATQKYLAASGVSATRVRTRLARVVASALSDLYSAVTTTIGVVRGPMHGGANGP